MVESKTHHFPMRIGEVLLNKITRMAAAEGMSRSAYANKIISEALRQQLVEGSPYMCGCTLSKLLPTLCIADALRREARCTLLLEPLVYKKLEAAGVRVQLPASTLVQLIFISKCHLMNESKF